MCTYLQVDTVVTWLQNVDRFSVHASQLEGSLGFVVDLSHFVTAKPNYNVILALEICHTMQGSCSESRLL